MRGVETNILIGRPNALPLSTVRDFDSSLRTGTPRDSVLLRSWSPDGVRPMALEMGPLAPADYVGVMYQGSIREHDTRNALYLRCTTHDKIKPIGGGGTNTTLTEAIVPLGGAWCPDGDVYLRLAATSDFRNVGVAPPYEVSALSYLKQSYLGYVGYFLAAFAILLGVFFVGGLIARITRSGLDPIPAGLISIGTASLAIFYAYGWTPLPAPAGVLLVTGLCAVAIGSSWRAPELARSVWRAQRGPVYAWFLTAFIAFTALHLGATGSGAWEPAYRFAPASWSTDHLLPGLFAEAVRVGTLPADAIIGGWSLSDRPPLMAGGYLLFADVFALLQANNDGPHLRAAALGVGGIALSSLWAAALYWAIRRSGKLPAALAGAGVLLIALTPFALFNTVYTWPKLMAAAFSLAAAAYAFRLRPASRASVGETTTFGALAGFAMLCHAASSFFLAPVSLVYFASRLWRSPKAMFAGAAVGLTLLGSWAAFKADVLPSHDPLLAYALTGELRLDQPEGSLPERLAARYRELTLADWLRAKAEIAAYLITPYPPPGPAPLVRPPAPGDVGLAAKLRNWDFYALSVGNLPLLLLGGLGAWGALRGRAMRPPQAALAGRLLISVAGCYALFVGVTFLPLFVHQFSYDAVLALGLAGVVAVGAMSWGRASLLTLAASVALYTGVVWILAPFSALVSLDLAAVSTLVLTVVGVGLALRPEGAARPAHTALVGLGLAVAVGGLLLLRPGAVVRQLGAPELAGMSQLAAEPVADPTSCRGSLDGIVARRAGGWRIFGWMWDVRAGAAPASVRILDRERLVGVATGGKVRPDVTDALPFVTNPAVGWFLDVEQRPEHPQVLATLADGSVCALGTTP